MNLQIRGGQYDKKYNTVNFSQYIMSQYLLKLMSDQSKQRKKFENQ